ncbi:MAG: hypothetical protein ACOYBR_04310 [Fluviibacter sp.]
MTLLDLTVEKVEKDKSLVGVEVKSAATVKETDLRGLRKLAGLAGSDFKMGVLLYDGDETMPLGDGIWAAPLSTLWGK